MYNQNLLENLYKLISIKSPKRKGFESTTNFTVIFDEIQMHVRMWADSYTFIWIRETGANSIRVLFRLG